MNYEDTIQYLYDSVPMFQKVGAAGYKEGLDNTYALDEHFGYPHRKFRTIHIAGTNGKGSCSHTIAAILQAEGYKVGLYTSPHLIDFRERIRINGKCISKEYVIDFVEKERSFFEPLCPSFFELTTAMAFKYFADSNVDIAVIEVGLGGRLDCTNIINPILSVITNISFDHTRFLGDTLAKIAAEKAGIIKKDVPVVIGATTKETRNVFIGKAEKMNAPVFLAEEEHEVISFSNGIYHTKSFGILRGELGGIYQEENTNTVLTAIKVLIGQGIIKNLKNIGYGLANVCDMTGLMGRWQLLGKNPTIVCDTGHNVGGWEYLSRQLKAQHCKEMRIVFGMVDDKDIDSVMHILPRNAVYYWTKAKTKRAINETTIMLKGVSNGLSGTCCPDVRSAYIQAVNDADKEDFIFIGGSSYIVADLLSSL